MTTAEFETDLIKTRALERMEPLCLELLPLGKKEGCRWLCGSIRGEPGRSFSVNLRTGVFGDFADGAKMQSSPIDLWMGARDVDFLTARQQLAAWLGIPIESPAQETATRNSGEPFPKPAPVKKPETGERNGSHPAFDWTALQSLDAGRQERLAKWRALSAAFVAWLVAADLIRILTWFDKKHWAFPVMVDGHIRGCHHRVIQAEEGKKVTWLYTPSEKHGGPGAQPLVIGDLETAGEAHVFESPWDLLAACDRLDLHKTAGAAAFCTRGAKNGEMVSRLPSGAEVLVWMQNDAEAQSWLTKIRQAVNRRLRVVSVPGPHKDLNDWTRAGATPENLWTAIQSATTVEPLAADPAPKPKAQVVEAESQPPVEWETSATSANSTGGFAQKAIYPADSLVEDWMSLAREQTESDDAFIVGAILPVLGALMARRVRFPWSPQPKFPNLFVMLAGKAGDRKSSIINLAKLVAQEKLPANAFLPDSFSPESLFDEYDIQKDGCPDKLWIVDDANTTLTDWQKMSNGERVATRFLGLYDCKEMSESFRRNKSKDSPKSKRFISQTSTSLLFGATFNIACFQGQAIRAGIARRFLYYVATRHGRVIVRPKPCNLSPIREALFYITRYECVMDFTEKADALWTDFQQENRDRIQDGDAHKEAELSRLASAPMQTLAVAMIFQAAICAKQKTILSLIDNHVLQLAIDHVEQTLVAAAFLDAMGDKQTVQTNAESLLARIRRDYKTISRGGSILLQRSELTARYAANPGRQGAWTPDDLYLHFIPALVKQGEAKLYDKQGKKEIYAFRDND